MKLKRLRFVDVAEVQEAVTDELKKVQKENFRQLSRNRTTAQKPVCVCVCVCVCVYIYIYAIVDYFEFKKRYVSSIKKKSSPKILDRTVCSMLYSLFSIPSGF